MRKPAPGTVCGTLTGAYALFGATLVNRYDWSAQAEDGTVILSLWANMFWDAERRVYKMNNRVGAWTRRWANRRRTERLRYALDHKDGLFESILIFQDDKTCTHVTRREIGHTMKIVALNDSTGHFEAARAS